MNHPLYLSRLGTAIKVFLAQLLRQEGRKNKKGE